MAKDLTVKEAYFVGSSRKDLQRLPREVRYALAYAILLAQRGGKHPNAKVLKGFGGDGVLEVVEDFDTNTYRAVYTVKFDTAVYVLHAFMKKSTQGRKTSAADMDMIAKRLRQAQTAHDAAKAAREIQTRDRGES
ncbi:type II toxin-antitoxin system RelE/ParE family toxin [Bradyrhizobium prioriisuperbiae]|uniref:type II toxin-antitoxin system RelE/ParE family toxin n=1 Tax=Bradyrhizobium prioriisuperbiae TaxID=2854389 RepID=UPI0028ECD985|nr:type II toxin-antitoxin system RelE/ParE family toxin [Bradyrhizobium prioritasuperba]